MSISPEQTTGNNCKMALRGKLRLHAAKSVSNDHNFSFVVEIIVTLKSRLGSLTVNTLCLKNRTAAINIT